MRLKKNQFEENFSLVFTVGIGDVYISLNLKKKETIAYTCISALL
jgi:hypothetical protein